MADVSAYHIPVMAQEVVAALVTDVDGIYVDCTLGGGGHAERILSELRDGRLIGFDRDSDALRAARNRLRDESGRTTLVHAPFGEVRERLRSMEIVHVDGIFMDLGVSSHHLDEARRGFSFQQDGPLDMRMDRTTGRTAADIVNTYELTELSGIITRYGEERDALRIARAILKARPVSTTRELAAAVAGVTRSQHATKTLARVFQALRIEVNDELGQLQSAMEAAPLLLRSGGRIVVLTYHSLEDRMVKEWFRAQARRTDPGVSRFLPERRLEPVFRLLRNKGIKPADQEIETNPRARSARMRAAEKI